ncbi:MAG TPA: hypothetical protein QGF58_28030 [Myxococcota bacterium]|nr:hypothetical protein [Myxococcota bacterium]
MDPTTAAAALSLTLFPTADHRELGVGPYTFEGADGPQLVDGLPSAGPQGLELMTRRVFDSEDSLFDDDTTPTGQGMRLRMYRDEDGEIVLDQFQLESLPFNFRIRPDLGDDLDIGLLAGTWDEVWRFGDTGRMQWRVYSPINATVIGMSKSDMGTDKLRYYMSLGTGLGGEILARVAGPVGLQARAEVEGNARRRRDRVDVHHTTRQEVKGEVELGLTLLTKKQAWVVGLWGEHLTQWEPFDEGGRDGVDRTYYATGARISGRFYKERERSLPVPGIGDTDVTDIDALLEALRRDVDDEGPEEDVEDTEDIDAAEPEQSVPEEEISVGPLEVHWSELEITEVVAPTWPADVADDAACAVRFFVDPLGTPYDVRPEDCPQALLPSTMEAAWGWRFAPIEEDGETVSAQFVYTLQVQDAVKARKGSSDGN